MTHCDNECWRISRSAGILPQPFGFTCTRCPSLPGTLAKRPTGLGPNRFGSKYLPCRGGQPRFGGTELDIPTRLIHNLRFMFIQVERGVELYLLCKELFQAAFVLEGATQLGTIVGQRLFLPFDFMVFVLGAVIETAEGMLDTRNRTERILGIEIGLVDLSAADKEVGCAVCLGRRAMTG
jgi:hypothetical protein